MPLNDQTREKSVIDNLFGSNLNINVIKTPVTYGRSIKTYINSET